MMRHTGMQHAASHAKRWRYRLASLALVALAAVLVRPALATETVTLYVTNAQGSVVATMTPQGDVTYTAAYRPYGKKAQGTPQPGPGYTGHVNDPDTGLVYMQQRYYDPETQRFISVDPIAPTPGNIYNFNRYAYANDNPIVNIDPTGMSCFRGTPTAQGSSKPCEVSPTVQRMRNTSDCGGCIQPSSPASSHTQTAARAGAGAGAVATAAGVAQNASDLGHVHKSWLGKWRGKNGKWYSESWGGNGATGARSAALKVARAFDLAGKGFFAISAVQNGWVFYGAAKSGARGEMLASGANLAWGAAGTFGGPVGLVGATVYTITSNVVNVPVVYSHSVVPIVDVVCRASGSGC